MELLLIQHGEAVSEERDPQRPLTDKGQEDVRRVAEMLRQANWQGTQILHSGKLRARQTAEILGKTTLPAAQVRAVPGLAPKDPVEWVPGSLTAEADRPRAGRAPALPRAAGRPAPRRGSGALSGLVPAGWRRMSGSRAGPLAVRWMLVPELFPAQRR